MGNSEENRKAVYDYLKRYTNYGNDYAQFIRSLDGNDKMRRVYYDKIKGVGGYEGSYDDFLSKLGVQKDYKGSAAQQVIDEYDASVRNNAQQQMINLIRQNNGNTNNQPSLSELVQTRQREQESNKPIISIAPQEKTQISRGVQATDAIPSYQPQIIEPIRYDSSQQYEEAELDKRFTPRPVQDESDIARNYNDRFALTQRGQQLYNEYGKKQEEIRKKYLKEFEQSPEYQKIVSGRYTTQEEVDAANNRINELFMQRYGSQIDNDLTPYSDAINDEMLARYGKRIEEDFNALGKKNALSQLYDLKKDVEGIDSDIKKRVRSHSGTGTNAMNALMGSRQYMQLSAKDRQEAGAMDAAKRLIEESEEIINEAKKKGNTNFVAGLLRGFRDNAFDAENWAFGLAEMADNAYLLNALQKSERGEKLSAAEEKLLEASSVNMIVNAYYSQDLGRGYKAGQVTAQSLPFMLEFVVNPISASGSGIAKSLLKFGIKKFGKAAMKKNAAKASARLLGDAAAAAGMTFTTGQARVVGGSMERLSQNYNYGLDDNGNIKVERDGDTSIGLALARSVASTFLENQSEMVFGALSGAGKELPEIISSISRLPGGELIKFFNSLKNAPFAKQLRERAKIGGVFEEYAEEVYNNLANVAIGEMSAEDAFSIDNNIDTFLGLVPTQLAFSAIGLGGLARENMAARRRLQAFEARLTDEEKNLFSQLQEAVRSGDNNVARDYIKATLANNSLTEQEKKERIFAAKDIVAAQQSEKIWQEQKQEEQEADAAYTEGATADPSTYYDRYKASRMAGAALEQADANLYETINRYLEDDASAGEVENLLSGLEGETEQLARNYLNSLMQLKGAEDAQMQSAAEALNMFEQSVTPYVYQNADGTRSITTGMYKERPVYVIPGEGGNVTVIYDDGSREMALSQYVEGQETSDYDEFIDNYSRNYLQEKEDAFRQSLENHPKTQRPAPGVVLHNGDMTYVVTNVSDDGYVDIVPAVYDAETGQAVPKTGAAQQTIGYNTAIMLQNDYYSALDENQAVASENAEAANNLSENQPQNESGPSSGESNVSETRVEETPEQRLANFVDTLPKKGKTEEIDYNAMTPQQRYEYTSLIDSPETAAQDLQADINAKQKELDDMQKKLESSVGGKRTELRDKMRKVRSELSELTDYYQSIATDDQTGSQRQPEGYSLNTREVVSDNLNVVNNEEDYLEWVADESEDALEVAAAYNLAKEMASRELKLNPWQQELLGTRVNTDSFKRFGDRNLITGTLAKSWLRKDGRDLDILAQELSVQTGMQVTEQDIVDFMLTHPSNRVSQTSDIMKRLSKKFSNIASAEMKFPVGGPESNTGKLYIRLKEAGQKVDELTGQQAQEAEEAVSEDIQDNITDIATVEDAITEEYATLYDEASRQMDEAEADRIAVEELEKEPLYNGMTAEELDEIYQSLEYKKYGTERQRTDSEQVSAEQVQEGIGESETSENERIFSEDDSENGTEDSGIEQPTEVANLQEPLSESPESANESRMNQIIERLDEIEYRLSELEGDTDIFSEAEQITLNNEKSELESEYNGLRKINATSAAIQEAREEVDTSPTEAQKEAGNYKKGHVTIDGLDITIENPKGSQRTGTDAQGSEWSITMQNDYGYIRGTKAVDGDHIDIFLSDNPTNGNVYVVDAIDQQTGAFDESKVMYGFESADAAREAYLSNYEEGWKVGTITEVSKEEFKKWIDSSTRKGKPFSEYKSINKETKQQKSSNRLVTDERYAELKERMRKKLGGQLNVGIDPEILAIGTEMAVYHIEKGARKFADYAKAMIEDLGDIIRPYLKAFYNGARELPEMEDAGYTNEMTPYDEVRNFDTANLGKSVVDVLAMAQTISDEQTIDKQVDEVKELAKEEKSKKRKPLSSKSSKKTISSQKEIVNDLFNQNQQEDEQGNQTENQSVGRETREENRGTESRGESSSVHGSDVPDQDGSRGIYGVTGTERTVTPKKNARNFRFGESGIDVPSGEIGKLKANIEAIRTLKEIENSGKPATQEQKTKLSRYVGWGGLANALDENEYRRQKSLLERYGNESRNYTPWGQKYYQYHEELKQLLTPEEFKSAIESTTTSHYTPQEIIQSIWDIVQRAGFKGGTISEPALGIGHILGFMPATLSDNSSISGFELDSLSGRIAYALYPDAHVKVQGYETEFAPQSKDLVITNVPFAKEAPYDKALDKVFRKKLGSSYNLHNYFILKSLLELKEGGLGVFVTSSATMDGVDSRFREYVSGNGIDLVGAIRLPNDAFQKNAGTSVTADILVFRKRKAGEPGNGNRFTSTTQIGKGSYQENGETRTKPIMVNEYFAEHPEMMLGEMMTAYDAGSGGLYSGASQTLKAKPGTDLGKTLNEAVQKLPENILDGTKDVSQQGRERTNLKNGLIIAKDDNVFVSENGELVPIEAKDFKYDGKTRKVSDAVNDYNEIKSSLKELIAEEQKENGKPEPLRKKLNELYNGFVEKYGTLNRNKALDDVFAEDVEHNLPLSLENVRRVPSATGKSMVYVVEKANGILNKRISYPVKEPEKAESLQDAINISQSYHGSMDVPYISRLLGISEEETANRLLEEGAAYKDPVTGELQDKDTYLSGNVREKLEVAIAAAENNPEYKKNVDDLMEVQPETVRFGDISFRLGTPWIPTEHVNKFAEDVLGISDADITYMPLLNEFVLGKRARVTDFAKAGLFRTDRLGVIEVLDSAINQRKPKIYDERTEYGPNGKTTLRIPNEAETQAASEKIMEVSDKFTEYIESRKDLHRELERIYNDRYNNYRLKEYRLPAFAKVEKNKEGNSVTIIHYPNSNNEISLREHQAKAVQRSLSESTLLAHQVGTGKTFTMITTAMEMRRLGIARKPMIVVQNATLEDFVRDFYKLYPGANVLAPSKDERSAENRKRLFNLIATGDFDAIVIPQSFLQFIPDDEGRKKQLIQKRIDELEEVLTNIEEYGLRKRIEREIEGLRDSFEGVEKKRKVKDQAKSAARIKAKMERQLDRRTDDVMTFEQMGIDALFIDEAHNYKKIGFATKMNNVKGVDSSASQRANSLLLKARWVQEKNGGRNVILATGTPITNTMAEVWTMMNFVAPEILDDYQINSFDDFATTFGTVEPSLEFTATGNFKIADRFKSYVNVPELVKAFRSHTDVVLTEDVKEFKDNNNIPKLKDGKMTNVVIDKNEDLQDVMQMLIDRLEDYNKMSGKEKREWSALPLVVFTKAKQAAIDLRLLNPSYPDNPNSKTNQVVNNIVKLYKESTPDKGTQLVFCDSYQSPSEQPKMDLFNYNPDVPRFNLYEDIREKLISKGIMANEIAIVNNYDGERRKTLFEKVRNGDVRVLLGSTEKMGVGVNVQDRLYALHHIDAPIRPMDFEQRNGRILRQGNLYAVWEKPVNVVTYGVQGTLDATAYDRLRIKQAFINQMMKGDVSGRVMEEQDEDDPSGMTFSQMAATLSGDKTAQLLFAAQNKLKRLRNLKRSDANSKSSMADTIESNRNRIIILEGQKKVYERAYSTVEKHFPEGVTSATVNGKTFTDKIGAELEPAISEYDDTYSLNRGISPLKISLNNGNAEVIVHYIEGRMVYEMYAGNDHIVEGRQFNGGKGLMSSIEHQLKATKKNLNETVEKINECEKRIEGLTKAINTPWGREDELKEAEKEVAKLQKQLEEKATENSNKKSESKAQEEDVRFRQGEGSYSDEELSMTNDPFAKLLGKSRQSKKQQLEYAERERRRMTGRARSIAEQLGLDNVEIVTDASTLEGEKASAKGFYDTKTGNITIVLPNHVNSYDVEQTILHEAVAHYGLRRLFGDNFNTFLDNVYNNASAEVRDKIDELSGKYNGNVRTATEEYLASLAEKTDFENAVNSGWFDKIKTLFLKMLAKVGISLPELTDNELRYILWRSYENLAHPGHYRNVFDMAADVAKQSELKVGDYAETNQEQNNAAADSDIRFRTSSVEELLEDWNKNVLNKPNVYQIYDESEIESLPYSNLTKRELKDKLNDKLFTGAYSNRYGTVFLFPDHITENAEELELTLWHETAHYASLKSGLDNKLKESCLEYIKQRYPNIYEEITEYYDESSWPEEAVAYLFERKIKEFGAKKLFSSTFAGESDIAETFTQLINFIKNGKGNTQSGRNSRSSGNTIGENAEGSTLQGRRNDVLDEKRTEGESKEEETDIFDDEQLNIVNKEVGSARDQYERTLNTASFKFTEAWQDSMLGLKEAQDAIAKATNSRILDYENAYFAENAMSSINLAEMDAFRNLVFKPILQEVNNLKKRDADYEEITDYLMLKHGIERNREMAVREALSGDPETMKENIERWNKEKKAVLESSGTWEEKQRQLDEIALTFGAKPKDYSGMTDVLSGIKGIKKITETAYNIVTGFERLYDTEELYKRIHTATDATMKKQVESGLMTKEMYQSISDMYEFYVPLRGWEEKTADEVYDYLTTEHSSFNAPIRKAKGRKSKADDPIATIANVAESGILQGNRNLVKQRFLTMVQNHRTDLASINDLWVQEIEKEDENGNTIKQNVAIFPEIPDKATPEQVERIVEAFNKRMEEMLKEEGSNVKRAADKPNVPYKILPKDLKEHQVIVKRAGKPYVVTINGNPRAAQAINGLTNPNATENPLIKGVEAANRFMAANFTKRNPAFVVSNMVRDGIYANTSVWIKESPLYAAKFNRNWAKSVKEMAGLVSRYKSNTLDLSNPTDRMFYDFIMNGGETGYTFINSVEDYKGIIQKEIKRANRRTLSIGKAMDVLGNAMDTFGRWAEDASRFAAYRTSREMGRSITRSINDAKEISVNFNKKGSGAKTAGKWEKGNRINALQAWASQMARGLYIFWNAGVQGLTNFGRLAKRNPGKFAAMASSYLVLGSLAPLINEVLCAALGGDDDDANYYNLPEYVRRNNICLYVGGSWLTIPLPIELRALYGLGEMACSFLSGEEKYKPVKVAGQISQILPIDFLEGSGGLNAFVPSYAKPIVEVYNNESWTGIPIYRDNAFNKDMPNWTKAYKSTSPELVKLSEQLNELTGGNKYRKGDIDINPGAIEYLFNSYLGGVATTIDQIKKTAMMPFNEDMQDWRNVVIANRFLKNADERSTKKRIDNEYFENKEEFDKIRQEFNGYQKELSNPSTSMQDFAKYRVLLDELVNSDRFRKYQEFNEMEKQLNRMYKDFKQSGSKELEEQMYILKEAMNEVAKNE